VRLFCRTHCKRSSCKKRSTAKRFDCWRRMPARAIAGYKLIFEVVFEPEAYVRDCDSTADSKTVSCVGNESCVRFISGAFPYLWGRIWKDGEWDFWQWDWFRRRFAMWFLKGRVTRGISQVQRTNCDGTQLFIVVTAVTICAAVRSLENRCYYCIRPMKRSGDNRCAFPF